MRKNDGKDLLAISYAVSSVLAEGKTADELDVLGAFFNVLGDSLSLIAARMDVAGPVAENNSANSAAPAAITAYTSAVNTATINTAAPNTATASAAAADTKNVKETVNANKSDGKNPNNANT